MSRKYSQRVAIHVDVSTYKETMHAGLPVRKILILTFQSLDRAVTARFRSDWSVSDTFQLHFSAIESISDDFMIGMPPDIPRPWLPIIWEFVRKISDIHSTLIIDALIQFRKLNCVIYYCHLNDLGIWTPLLSSYLISNNIYRHLYKRNLNVIRISACCLSIFPWDF